MLLSNALKYSPQGQPIEFRVQKDGDRTVFEVIDQGIGIPQAEIAHLFDSFHRASNVGPIAGTGLGLSIVRQLADANGWQIELRARPGGGLEAWLSVPRGV